ncbi:autotransporter assembly complex protein TamB [Thorsellia kenyensis]|uniref:Translocation/assembly module TamB domain-containing protein n=1 Tax=Thorsellia kenyensis TaxID=1549888 RepID=A0ABV6CD01_9GAMM
MKIFKRIIYFFLLPMVGLILSLVLFILTPTGIGITTDLANRHLTFISINNVKGGWGALSIDSISVSLDGIDVKVDDVKLSLSLRCLFKLNLCINDLSVAKINVNINTHLIEKNSQLKETNPPAQINLPFGIHLSRLMVSDIAVRVDNMRFSGNGLKTHGSWYDKIILDEFLLDSMNINMDTDYSLTKTSSKSIDPIQANDNTVQTNFFNVDELRQTIEDVKSNLENPVLTKISDVLMPMDFVVPNFKINHLSYEHFDNKITTDELNIAFDIQGYLISILHLNTEIGYCDLRDSNNRICANGKLNLNGSLQMKGNWPLTTHLSINIDKDEKAFEKFGLQLDNLSLLFNAKGALIGELISEATIQKNSLALLDLKLTSNFAKPNFPLSINLTTETIAWPMINFELTQANRIENNEPLSSEVENISAIKKITKESYRLLPTEVKLAGDIKLYSLTVTSAIEIPQLPPTEIMLNAELFQNKAVVNEFSLVQADKAKYLGVNLLKMSAILDWSKDVFVLTSNLDINNFQLNDKKQGIDLKTSGRVGLNGKLSNDSYFVELADTKLTGNLNNYPIDIEAQLSGSSLYHWTANKFNFAVGENSINLSGSISDKVDISLLIDAPKLSGIVPNLKGNVQGNANITGTTELINVNSDININGFNLDSISISSANLKSSDLEINWKQLTSNTQELGEFISGEISLGGADIKLPSTQINTIDTQLVGTNERHEFSLNLNADPISALMKLSAQFDSPNKTWNSTIKTLELDTPEGAIKNKNPIELLLGVDKFSLSSHCWVHQAAEVCLAEDFELKQSTPMKIAFNKIDIDYLNKFLTPATVLKGTIKGEALLYLSDLEAIRAQMSLDSQTLGVVQNVNEANINLDLEAFSIKADYEAENFSSTWDLKIKNNGSTSGNIEINDILNSRQLSGNLKIADFNLSLLSPFFADNEKIHGVINSGLIFSGTTLNPLVTGDFLLSNLLVVSHQIPFDINDSRLAIRFNGKQSNLDGEIVTNDGILLLDGSANWENTNNWNTVLNARSEGIGIVMPPQVQIKIKPDIRFEANSQLLSLSGNVLIPWARIIVDELPQSVIDVSDSQVFLDENMQPIEKQTNAIPFKTDLNIKLGDNILLSAFGLNTALLGELNVRQSEQGIALFGDIVTQNGSFRAYGQDLVLRKGVISFAGTPDRPKLNVEAVRNPNNIRNDVVAGVRVTGFADEPRLELFSIPSMSQEEILSYILRGEGLDASGADSSLMTTMLIGMGTSQSGQLIGRIGETFGVKNLSLDTQGAGDESQVVVSGEVLPGLQVRYGVGVFDSLATITLRYQLLPRLYLEAVSGMDQAIDLLYQFEFD